MTTDQWIAIGQGVGPILAVVLAWIALRYEFGKRYDPFNLELFRRKLDGRLSMIKLVMQRGILLTNGTADAPTRDTLAQILESSAIAEVGICEPLLDWIEEGCPVAKYGGMAVETHERVREAIERDMKQFVGRK